MNLLKVKTALSSDAVSALNAGQRKNLFKRRIIKYLLKCLSGSKKKDAYSAAL